MEAYERVHWARGFYKITKLANPYKNIIETDFRLDIR
jgi:hypothetical protein